MKLVPKIEINRHRNTFLHFHVLKLVSCIAPALKVLLIKSTVFKGRYSEGTSKPINKESSGKQYSFYYYTQNTCLVLKLVACISLPLISTA